MKLRFIKKMPRVALGMALVAVFNYHPDFIKKGVEIAPLTASVKGPAAKGMPILGNTCKIQFQR